MAFDIIYDNNTKKLLKVYHNPPVDGKHGSIPFSTIVKEFGDKCDFRAVTWINNIPPAVYHSPSEYQVHFGNPSYYKPTHLINRFGTKFDLCINQTIRDGKILFCGPTLDYLSFANINRDIIFDLLSKNYNVKIFTSNVNRVEIDTQIFETLKSKSCTHKEKSENDHLKIMSYIPITRIPHSAYTIAYTMFEYHNIRINDIKNLQTYNNELWVPTNYMANRIRPLIDSRNRLEVMPLWFDEDKFSVSQAPYDCEFELVNETGSYPKYPTGYKFLFFSRHTQRKGVDVAVKAFAEEFSDRDDVSLVLFTRHIVTKKILEESVLESLKSWIRHYPHRLPPIYLHRFPIPEDKTPGVFGWGDCHVLPSRGEGFGLTAIEAAACGLPQILTANSGLSDFVDDSVAYVINDDMVDQIGYSYWENKQLKYVGKYPAWAPYITKDYRNTYFSVLGDDAVRQTRIHMRSLYEGKYHDVEEKISRFKDCVYSKYTKQQGLDRIRNRINDILKDYGSYVNR